MFLSIITRTCHREKFLTDNIKSVKAQTFPDIEQVFIVDRERKGIQAADKALAKNKARAEGEYSFILDDDCWLINDSFVQELYDFVGQEDYPPVVLFKSRRPKGPPSNETVFPTRAVWGKTPKHGTTNCLCYAIRTPIWKQWIEYFGVKPWGGDWHFLEQVIKQGHSHEWLDIFSGESRQLGRGRLFENVQKGWFERVAKQEGLVNLGEDDWRLQLWKE